MSTHKPKLPLVPGLSFNSNVGKEYFGRSQKFCLPSGTRMLVDKPIRGPPSLYSKTLTPNQPAWLLFDKQILVFDAYYQSTLEEMRFGPALIRQVKLFFYLEDGTMKVIEPKTLNSSQMQGTIVSRQRIPIPRSDNLYYDILHLNIDQEINVFGKTYMIVNCDKFTRSFLSRLGIRVPDPLEVPSLQCTKPIPGRPKQVKHVKSEKQFLEFDKKVLKFRGFWDNRGSQYGKLHHLDIFYYLADDTMEIKEKLTEEDSTDTKALFLRRCYLPKEVPYCLMSPEAIHPEQTDNFTPSDLIIGAPISVYGRMVILTDCDGFTKEYYKVKYGIDNFDPVLPPVPLVKPRPRKVLPPLPPWNGMGTHEDSAGNCRSMVPKPDRKNMIKFFEKDKIGYDSNTLRFLAKIISIVKEYDIRRFVISYYLSDDSISVYETGDRSSPYQVGTFFKRGPVIMPGQNLYTSDPPVRYTSDDLWVGNCLVVNQHCFQMIDSDEYTLRYMELSPHEFPKSNIKLIMEKIRNKFMSQENFYKDFVAKNMKYVECEKPYRMTTTCFENAIKEVMCADLTEHEFITVTRHFKDQEPEEPCPKKSIVRALVYEDLLRWLWQDYDRFGELLRYLDEYQNGSLPEKTVWQSFRAVRLPISDDLLRDMLCCIGKNQMGEYCIQDILDFLNFKLKPPPTFIVRPSKSAKHTQNKKPTYADEKLDVECFVNWDHFLKYLNLEQTISAKP